MRSSKSRSRSKQNRPRTIGNIVNRVFDSSGPDGKVRGTPQQIIEKYQALARDAQLSNDRVAAENFLQHAEHYTRMLGEAMREMAAEQEARRQFQGQHGNGNGNGNGHHQGGGHQGGERLSWQPQSRRDDRVPDEQPEIAPVPVFPFEDADSTAADVGLVETPEDRAAVDTAPVVISDEPRAEPMHQPREARSGERQPRQPREPRDEGQRSEGQRGEGQRRASAPKRDDDRRSEQKRDNRRKEERRPEDRKPRESAVAEVEASPAEAPVAAAEKAPRAAAKPRRAPATRSRTKTAADADAAPVTSSDE